MHLQNFFVALVAFALAHTANANRASEDIRVEGLQLTQTTRVDRTVFRYTYRVRLRNVGPEYTNVNALATSTNPATTMVDGNVSLASIAAHGSAMTVETIVLQHDQTVTFNPADLRWQITASVVDAPPSTDPQETSSSGTLQIQGALPNTFNSRSVSVSFQAEGASLRTDPVSTVLIHNGLVLPNDALVLNASAINLGVLLHEGRNDFVVYSVDTNGGQLFTEATVWAGNATMLVSVQNTAGQAVPASVRIKLADDAEVSATHTFTPGTPLQITNLPRRTILIEAEGVGNARGTAAEVAGTTSGVTVIVRTPAARAPSTTTTSRKEPPAGRLERNSMRRAILPRGAASQTRPPAEGGRYKAQQLHHPIRRNIFIKPCQQALRQLRDLNRNREAFAHRLPQRCARKILRPPRSPSIQRAFRDRQQLAQRSRLRATARRHQHQHHRHIHPAA